MECHHCLAHLVIVEWALPTFPPSYHPQFENPDLSSLPHPQTPDHQRAYTPGASIILTLITFNRRPTLTKSDTVNRLLAP